jgi:peptidoglycan/xylan/chitin deacetylase (PgdA/CDA1 family)
LIVSETLFAFTNDDAGGQDPHLFRELLDFLAGQGVVATFFVVPMAGGRPLHEKPEWIDLLSRALNEGHELQLHAFDHGSTFEFGVPPGFMLDIIPEAKARWEREPDVIQASHSLAHMRERIARGKELFQRALGDEPRGFRGPCLSMCDNTYQALAENGFLWSSNMVVNPMGWRYINRDYEAGEPWQADVPPHPFRHEAGLVEVPMLSEYTWYLEVGDLERHFALIKDDFDRVRAASGTFVTLSHYYAMTGEWSTGLRVYERLFAYARERCDVRFCTVSQLLERYLFDNSGVGDVQAAKPPVHPPSSPTC